MDSLARQVAVAQAWPALPLDAWRDTYATLHMWTQIVGKTRLALSPMENHWWQVTFYVTPRGLTTSAMPYGDRSIEVEFDFISHALSMRSSDGATHSFALAPCCVADWFAQYRAALRALGVEPVIMPSPVEVDPAIPFAQDREHASYDADAVNRWWRIVASTDRVLKRYRGGFDGKQSPVHFFWGAFDLAVTRFCGRTAPPHPGGVPNCPDHVMVEAYSHECASCGFWPGGGAVAGPAFYAYAYPEPPGYAMHAVLPAAARYDPQLREYVLPYEAVRNDPDPETALLSFLQSAFESAAENGRWSRVPLERSACDLS
jgi:hypothetical protein